MITDNKKKCLELYSQALKLYRNKEFKNAIIKFNEALKYDPDDGPSKVFIERCKYLQTITLPDDWDGVYDMKTK